MFLNFSSSVVMHGGVLFVLGGRDGTGLDSIESWDSEAVPQPPQFQTHPHALAKSEKKLVRMIAAIASHQSTNKQFCDMALETCFA